MSEPGYAGSDGEVVWSGGVFWRWINDRWVGDEQPYHPDRAINPEDRV